MTIRVKLSRPENLEYFGCKSGDVWCVDLEDYVAAVVASEAGNAPIEACKAQAIAARTYALPYIGQNKQITDQSSVHQAFRAGRWDTTAYPNAYAATRATESMVLTYGGETLSTCVYSSSNSGTTRSAKERWGSTIPYLIAQADPWDTAYCAERIAAGKSILRGHAVGMSQYGASWAAAHGVKYPEILAFYYPGTAISLNYGEEGEDKTMAFTGKQLANFASKAHDTKWVYWYGTCGYKASDSLLASKSKQYPDQYTNERLSGYKADISASKMCADCVGIIKAFFWMRGDMSNTNKYQSNNCPDVSANGMYDICKATGPISSIPDIPGLIVWKNGHIGVYVGGGYTVEMQGFATDCLKRKVTAGSWTNWGRLPDTMISYAADEEIQHTYKLGERTLQKGDEGGDVIELQTALKVLGHNLGTFGANKDGVDGDFGSQTQAAVIAVQAAAGLPESGVFDTSTYKVLLDTQKPATETPVVTPPDPEPDTPDDGGAPAYVLIIEGDEDTLRTIQRDHGGTLAEVDTVTKEQNG